MSPKDSIDVTLPVLILEAVKLAKDRAAGIDVDISPLFGAIRHFYQAYHRAMDPPGRNPAPPRFAAAIRAVEPGIYDAAPLADTMIVACDEIAFEGGFAPTDPAVRLLGYQIATICLLAPDRSKGAEAIFECTRRTFGL